MKKDPYRGPTPTRPRQQAPVETRLRDDDQTMVKCPTCAGVEHPKLGCPTCTGAGFVTFEQYAKLTCKCPTCLGTGRITHEQNDALEEEAARREQE